MARRDSRSGGGAPSDAFHPIRRWEDVSPALRERIEGRLAAFSPLPTGAVPAEGDHRGKLDLNSLEIDASAAVVLVVDRLATLTGLTSLNIRNNSIGDAGARAIAEHLTGLNSLDISENSLGEAGARAIAEHLTGLNSLSISENSIGDAGARAIAEHLTGLNSLDISDNSIDEAGARAIAEHLTGLNLLNIRRNSITDAETLIAVVRSLRTGGQIALEGNMLRTPEGNEIEPSAFSFRLQPAADVLRYLQDTIAKDAKLLPEARIVLVGVGRNGKSQLARWLGGSIKAGERIPDEDRTIGVDVETIELPTRAHKKLTARIFDCGGQPEQYQIHRLFWESHRNIMVLVVDATKIWEFDGNRGDYFLRMIEAEFGRRNSRDSTRRPPPVLALVTKADRMGEVAEDSRFPTPERIEAETSKYHLDIRVVEQPVDAVRQTHFDLVKAGLIDRLDCAEGLAARVPRSFHDVRTKLQRKFGTWKTPKAATHGMSVKDYRHLCVKAGQKNEGQQDFYLRILAALGDVIQVTDDGLLKNTLFNIHWARKALYHVLTDRTIREERGGIMLLSDFERMTDTMPPDQRNYLKELSEQMGVAYPMQERLDPVNGRMEDAWLIPDLLQPIGQSHLWCDGKPTVTITYDGFLSEAVFLRFVAAYRLMIRNVRTDAHRNEVLLTRPDRIQAVVRAEYDGPKHRIAIWADPQNSTGQSYLWCTESLSWVFRSSGGDHQAVPKPTKNEPDHSTRPGSAAVHYEMHFHGPVNTQDLAGVKDMLNDNSVGKKAVITNSQVGQILNQCHLLIQSQAPADRKEPLQELERQVKELIEKLPEEEKEKASESYEMLVKQATKSTPDRKWYSLSAEGLLEAAKFVQDFGVSLAGPLLSIGKAIWGSGFKLG